MKNDPSRFFLKETVRIIIIFTFGILNSILAMFLYKNKQLENIVLIAKNVKMFFCNNFNSFTFIRAINH